MGLLVESFLIFVYFCAFDAIMLTAPAYVREILSPIIMCIVTVMVLWIMCLAMYNFVSISRICDLVVR